MLPVPENDRDADPASVRLLPCTINCCRDTYSPTSVVVLSTDLDGSLSGSTSGSGRLSRFASRFTFNPVVRRGPVSATMPVSIERDYDIGTSASAGNRIEEIVTEVRVGALAKAIPFTC